MTFFEFMKARQEIYLKKQAGDPWPWSDDPIFQTYSFTNVYRENDKTTIWFKENIRAKLRINPVVIFATIAFRWFNRIETANILIGNCKIKNVKKPDGLELFYNWDPLWVYDLLKDMRPWVTGAYIIKTPNGMNKLAGVIDCINNAWDRREELIKLMRPNFFHDAFDTSLEEGHKILMSLPFMGKFMSYEVITDLRHTRVYDCAEDITTWANPGPGAMRGINRILHGKAVVESHTKPQYIKVMYDLLQEANKEWHYGAKLEMREIEHSLCEYDKYLRVLHGEGRPRSKYAHIHTDAR